MSNKIILIIAGFLGYVGYKKYLLSQNVKINFRDLSIDWANIWHPSANIVLSIDNPTNASADIQNITGKLFLQNVEIGKVENLKILKKIEANQTTNFNFNINIDTVGVGVGLLTSNLKNEIIKFHGSIKVDFVTIPLHFEYKIL